MKYVCNLCDPGCQLESGAGEGSKTPRYCPFSPTSVGSCDWQPVRTTRLMTTEECKAWACTEGAQGWQCRTGSDEGWRYPQLLSFTTPSRYQRRTVQWNDGRPIYGEPQPMDVTV